MLWAPKNCCWLWGSCVGTKAPSPGSSQGGTPPAITAPVDSATAGPYNSFVRGSKRAPVLCHEPLQIYRGVTGVPRTSARPVQAHLAALLIPVRLTQHQIIPS